MSAYKSLLIAVAAASITAVGFTLSGWAQQDKSTVGELKSNEGIFVDPASFAILKGTAKTDPTAQIAKLGAREVNNGAIIFRVGDKLYLADAELGQKSLLNAFWEQHDRMRP
jgi:hypothetical protein